MSQLERQKEERKNGKKASKESQGYRSNIFTIYLSREQKLAISESPRTLDDVLDGLDEWFNRGCKLTIGQDLDRGAYYLIFREPGPDWTKNRALSAWHASTGRCLQILDYYLREVNPEWPENVRTLAHDDFEW